MELSKAFGLKYLMLTCLVTRVVGMEIYLRQLEVYTSHENNFLPNAPEVYLICEDDRGPLMLRQVVEINKAYKYKPEQIPITHVKEGQCVKCALMEFDIFDSDDNYGQMNLCEENFRTGVSEVKAEGEFHARFECPMCKERYEQSKENVMDKADSVAHESRSYVQNSIAAKTWTSENSAGGKGTSTVAVILISLAMFVVGAAIGGVAVRHLTVLRMKREKERVHELNSILSQTDVPFDRLPKHTTKREIATKAGGVSTYHQLAIEDGQDNH